MFETFYTGSVKVCNRNSTFTSKNVQVSATYPIFTAQVYLPVYYVNLKKLIK
jgi:hypothetical protein